MPTIRYPAHIITWPKEDIDASGSRSSVERRKKKRDHHGRDKALHRMYHRQIEEVADIEKTYQWLKKSGLLVRQRGTDHGSTRTGLEQRSIEAGVYHTRLDWTICLADKF